MQLERALEIIHNITRFYGDALMSVINAIVKAKVTVM
jgi:hypothetical protein